ncbi:MAG: LL-diaminopimelate aminotransferase [Clostridia bacterium]|nr:LL-diaminopimelate aminotransferase [Clostridia bacterium]
MAKINLHYGDIKESYLFSEIAKRVNEYKENHPDADIIRMGIGDVTQPLVESVVDGLVSASKEMGKKETFHGYGPEQGYSFLKEKIVQYYQSEFGVELDPAEVFISDGAKSDIANVTDLFSNENVVCVPDPVYPVYLDTNLMLGRKVVYLQGNESNGFLPLPTPETEGDIFYLCSPNNPTGATYSREQLRVCVNFALERDAVILFDAAYERFVSEDLPRSIFEIEGAKKCAIEFCSLSKTAGFTGTRCGYTIVPLELVRQGMSLNKMWLRRQTTKFNGVSYIVQRGAERVFCEKGLSEISAVLAVYQENARIIANTLRELGIWFSGGVNSPYIWLKCPNGMTSWEFFDFLLDKARVVGTPGSGFGECGEGYFRLTAFSTKDNTVEAMRRIKTIL